MARLDEMDALLPGEVRQGSDKTTWTLGEIESAHRRLPLDQAELELFQEVVSAWRREGRDAAPWPLDKSYLAASEDERRERVIAWWDEGLHFVSSVKLNATLLIAKVDNGCSHLGGQNINYACFFGSGNERYHSVGTSKKLLFGMAKLGKLYAVNLFGGLGEN